MIKINIFNYNKSGNNEKNVIKDKPKQIIKKIGMLILKKLILILLPVAMIMIIISAATWYVFQDEGTWDTKEKGNPSTYTKSGTISGTNGITVDKKDMIRKNLLNIGYTDEQIDSLTDIDIIRIFKINTKLNKIVTSLDELTHAELLWCMNTVYSKYLTKVEDLEYLLNAELVTQYPKIDNLSEDKLNGIVTFERHQVDPDTQAETVTTLRYISNDEFTSLFESYKQTGKKDIFSCFTLDDSGNAKIATWIREEGAYNSNNTTSQNDRKKIRSGVTGEDITGIDERYAVQNNNADSINASYTSYYISEQSINYKSMIQQYTLPFEYLWSLLVMGDSSDFALKLAQLAYNSEIKIGVYDNIVKTIETNTEKYTEQFRERYRYYEDGSLEKWRPTDTEWKEEKHDYEHVNVVTTYTDTVQIEVMHANTWTVEVTVNYNNTVTNGDGYENEVLGSDEEWDTSDSTYRSWTESSGSEEDGTEETISCEEYYDKHKRTINKSNISKLETVNSTYQKEPSEIKEKTDTDENTDMNFVKLFKDDYNVRTNLSNPSTVNWLISILENNADTNNMVDLTKYLIYKATNNKSFKVDYDFGVFDTTSYSSVSEIYGGSVEEKLWYSLKASGYSDYAAAGLMGNLKHESSLQPNNLQDSFQKKYGTDEEYTNNMNNGVYSYEEIKNDEAGYGIVQWTKSRKAGLYRFSQDRGTSIDDIDTQIIFLLGELTGKGEAASYTTIRKSGWIKSEKIISTNEDWANATSVDDATLYFMRFFESPGNKSSLENRQKYAESYYEMFKGKTNPEVNDSTWTRRGKVSFPRYSQSDSRWGNNAYNYKTGGTIRSGGCGASALAMAVSGFTKQEVTPANIVNYLNSINVNTVYNGAKSAQQVANKYGLTYSFISRTDVNAINTALDAGKCLIFSIKANGIYTGSGHFIMCYGREGSEYFVIESGSFYQTDRGYSFNQVFTRGSQGVFVIGK